MAKYLVTGASGFVGSRLVNRLLKVGHSITAVGRRTKWVEAMMPRSSQQLTIFSGDLENKAFVESVWRTAAPFDGVFHFAAQIPADIKGVSPDYGIADYVKSNVTATATLLDSVSQQGKIPFVYASTISVFGHVYRLPIDEDHPTCPSDSYGLTKLMGEECVKLAASTNRIHASILRFPGMIGIGNDYGAVHFFTSLCIANKPVNVYGNGLPQKDYIGVEDVVEASILAMGKALESQCEVFNVGGCQPGFPPPNLLQVAQIVADAWGGAQVTTNDRNPAEPVHAYFSNIKPSRLLGYIPPLLESRIREYVAQRKALLSSK